MPHDLINIAANGRRDPTWFSRKILRREPWSMQHKVLQSVKNNEETSVKTCHSAGKTAGMGAPAALWFLNNFYPSIVLITAPTDRQVKDVMWKEIRTLHAQANSDKNMPVMLPGFPLQKELRLSPEHFAIGFTAPDYDPNKFQGYHSANVLIIQDEASGISTEIDEACDAILSSGFCRKLRLGNPTDPMSAFAASFKRKDIEKFTISAFHTPNFTKFGLRKEHFETGEWRALCDDATLPKPYLITPQWVNKMYHKYKGWDHPYMLGRILAEFPKDSKYTLIQLSWIEAAHNTYYDESQPPRVFGVDIGRGGDPSVIYERNGSSARLLDDLTSRNTMATVAWIREHADERKPEVINIDVIGIGAGVYDRLNELDYNVRPANAAARANDPEKYKNAKAEWLWDLRTRFEEGRIDISDEDEDFTLEASSIKQKITSGRIQIEEKEETKKRIGQSPNSLDACALAFADIPEENDIFII